jgi:hypothetical protein
MNEPPEQETDLVYYKPALSSSSVRLIIYLRQ